jgi:hypothetical protein
MLKIVLEIRKKTVYEAIAIAESYVKFRIGSISENIFFKSNSLKFTITMNSIAMYKFLTL